jgi:hypothetical protein
MKELLIEVEVSMSCVVEWTLLDGWQVSELGSALRYQLRRIRKCTWMSQKEAVGGQAPPRQCPAACGEPSSQPCNTGHIPGCHWFQPLDLWRCSP